MAKSKNIDKISLSSKNGFPNEGYCFTDGVISIQIEKNGGINELHYISILKEGDTFYPDRNAIRIFSKERVKPAGWGEEYKPEIGVYSYGLYGPVLRFISTTKDGRNLYHVPDKIKILPFGFVSSSDRFGIHTEYNMCIKDRMIIFYFKNLSKDKENLNLLLITPGLASGEIGTWRKQHGGENEVPLEQRKGTLTWEGFKLDEDNNCLYVPGKVGFFQSEDEPICVAISSDNRISITKEEYDYKVISAPWNGRDEMQFYILLNETYEECRNSLKEVKRYPEKPWRMQIKHYTGLVDRIPEITVKNYPVVSEMARAIPLFLNAMKLNETETMVTTRAATHKYAYFIGWDVFLPARKMLLWGEYKFVEKVIEHAMTFLGRNYLWTDFMFFCLIGEYYNLTRDKKFIDRYYPRTRDGFLKQISDCDIEGMKIGTGFGGDDMRQLKQDSKSPLFAPDGIGWLFNACRYMENMAMIKQDNEVVSKSMDIAARIDKTYLTKFYDEEAGFLVSAIDAKTGRMIKVHQNVVTGGMEGLYGDLLLYDKIDNISNFIKNQLYHPSGRSAVPYWDIADEMWKSCIMLQHANHESRTLRFAKESEELMRMWRVYLELFNKNKLQIETLNLCGSSGDAIYQRADWQAFAAASQYGVLLAGIVGIDLDYRGITYLLCNMALDISIKKLIHGKTIWDVEISGKGEWIDSIYVDGEKVKGSAKVPSIYFNRGNHILRIRRGSKTPDTPYILRAVGAGITVLDLTKQILIAELDGTGRIPIRFYSTKRPKSCRFDGKETAFKWNEVKKTGLAEVILKEKGEFCIYG